ncbi:hypothetical protein AURANDRAFT_65592 [Aureococcus anophagefferens]|uniref:PHD-type domain-containing protein n=1 Tax=Aureococcus anophagefferens TaxID=44056 RepID=F0YEG6_AURAN|nr:hypothetical protein AURANDRAFT_65592 [Aureococcus anophagefferens]EGB06554.1 hypothetical protein AURANDRAFT_65592 [Aureococcus anophagefferens]|eukprot:XP_009038729.1 hypothetical protein AURANDRAFT_65592 [Aureococcus anophagefferens]
MPSSFAAKANFPGIDPPSEAVIRDYDAMSAPAKVAKAMRVVASLRDSAKRVRESNRRSRTSKKQRVSKGAAGAAPAGAAPAAPPRRPSGRSRKQISYAEGDDDDDASDASADDGSNDVSKDAAGSAPAGAAPAGAAPAGAADGAEVNDFHCGACALRDTPLMIQCEACDSWFHFGCVDLTSETVPDGAFFCGRCAAARAEEASASAALVALAVPTLDAPAAPHVLDADHRLVAKLGGFFSNAASAPVEKRKRDDALRGLKKVPDLHRDLTLVLTSQNQHYRSLRVCFQSSVVDVVFRLLAFTLTDEFFEEDNKVACAMAWLAELVETVHDPKTRRFLTAKRDIICRIVGRLGNRLLDCGFTVQEARREAPRSVRPAGVWPGGSFDGVFAWISKLRA